MTPCGHDCEYGICATTKWSIRMMHTVGVTRNEQLVRVDLAHSNAAHTISLRPHLLTLAGEALSGIVLDDASLIITRDMGRAIGYDFVVEMIDRETVFYAQVANSAVFTPFTKKGDPASTNLLTMVLRHSETDGYYLDDLWPGPFRPSLPDGETPIDGASDYWAQHAYIFEDQRLKASSITRTCPY